MAGCVVAEAITEAFELLPSASANSGKGDAAEASSTSTKPPEPCVEIEGEALFYRHVSRNPGEVDLGR